MESSMPAVSVVMPALNEAHDITNAAEMIFRTMGSIGISYELILVNDGSTDETSRLMEMIVAEHPEVARVIHNRQPHNLGGAYWRGVEQARGEYVIMVPGDNEESEQTVRSVLGSIGKADLLITYPANSEVRPWHRRFISLTYVALINALFRMSLRYFNGACLIRRDVLLRLYPWTPGFSYMSEIIIRSVKSGATYIEVPTQLNRKGSGSGRSKALSVKNVWLTGKALCRLLRLVYLV